MSKTGAVLSLFKSKNKLECVIMGIMIICLGAYLSISYAGTVYPQMDATVFFNASNFILILFQIP